MRSIFEIFEIFENFENLETFEIFEIFEIFKIFEIFEIFDIFVIFLMIDKTFLPPFAFSQYYAVIGPKTSVSLSHTLALFPLSLLTTLE